MVMIVVLVCLRLSYWQLQRADSKAQQLTQIASLQDKGVMNWQQMQQLPNEWNKTGLQLLLTGTLIPNYIWLLDNQVYQGQVGYDVLVLLRLENNEHILLVNLGWVKAPISREQLPSIKLPHTSISLHLQLKQGNLKGFTLQGADQNHSNGWPRRVQFIDLESFILQSSEAMVDFIGYRLGAGDDIATPHYEAVVMSPDKHRAYALQWLLIAVACVVVAIFASKKRK